MSSKDRDCRIGAASKLTGLTPRQIRYYEDLGLVSPQRSEGGVRSYTPADIDRLHEIRVLFESGDSVDRVRRKLGLGAAGSAPKPECDGSERSGVLKIGDLADRTGLSERTLRHYEELGIINSARSEGGTRLYDFNDVEVARTVSDMRRLGIPIETLVKITTSREKFGSGDSACQFVNGVIKDLMQDIDEKLEGFLELRRDLERASVLVGQCRGCPNAPNPRDCPDCPMETQKSESRIGQLIWEH